MVQPRGRSPTPPPIEQPFQSEESEDLWYWGDRGGGMVVDFGKHKGKKVHEVSLYYLMWCSKNFERKPWNVSV